MPVVFVIARDWKLRAMVRAELRERGVTALGMQTGSEAGERIASGIIPAVVVLEAEETGAPGLAWLARRVPFVVVASGLDATAWPQAAKLLRRPVRVGEIVAATLDLLEGRQA